MAPSWIVTQNTSLGNSSFPSSPPVLVVAPRCATVPQCGITRPERRMAISAGTRIAAALPPDIAVNGKGQLARRAHAESPHAYRSPFARDSARILHARAFRRLAGKTQVFTRLPGDPPGDHFRSRLTHTLEVTQISRTLATVLGLNTELVRGARARARHRPSPLRARRGKSVRSCPPGLWPPLRPQPACLAHRHLV